MTLIKFKHLQNETIDVSILLISRHLEKLLKEKASLQSAVELYSRLRLEEEENLGLQELFRKLRVCDIEIQMAENARKDLMGVYDEGYTI